MYEFQKLNFRTVALSITPFPSHNTLHAILCVYHSCEFLYTSPFFYARKLSNSRDLSPLTGEGD